MKPRVVYEGRAPDGALRSGTISADTLAEAERTLLAEGLTGLRFFNDPTFGETGAASAQALADASHSPTVKTYAKLFIGYSISGALVASCIVGTEPVGRFLAVAAGAAAILAVWLVGPLTLYTRAQRQMRERRYEEAISTLEVLTALNSIGPGRFTVVHHLLVAERARALAGMGRLEDGLRALGTLAARGEAAAKIARAQEHTLYDHARDFPGMAARLRASLAKQPDDGSAWLDLAITCAVRLRDLDAASDALQRATEHPQTEMAKAVLDLVRSVVVLPVDPPRSLELAHQSHAAFSALVPGEFGVGFRALMTWQRARAHIALGQLELADRALAECVPYLLRGGDTDLLDWVRQERAAALSTAESQAVQHG